LFVAIFIDEVSGAAFFNAVCFFGVASLPSANFLEAFLMLCTTFQDLIRLLSIIMLFPDSALCKGFPWTALQ
jgi:hypothetical protein